MTEDEAKTKACPRAATFGASQQLADGPGPHCIASACMAWRNGEPTRGPLLDSKPLFGASPGRGWVAYYASGENTPRSEQVWALLGPSEPTGYCGLAGAPDHA